MIFYDHFAIAIEYLKTINSKPENVDDLLLFFTTFIKELDNSEENLSLKPKVWSVFPQCMKIVEQDRNKAAVPLDAAEKIRWTALLAAVKSECHIV
jgi:hypothetical protein